jgi:signal peptidase II
MVILTIIGLILLIVLDQFSKYWMSSYLTQNGDIRLWENVLHFTYVENKGAAFGILQGRTMLLLIIVACVILIIPFIYVKLPKDKWGKVARFALVFITAGAIGNFIDRLLFGYVRDFIYFVPINFPVFNIADVLVVVGVGILTLSLFYSDNEDMQKEVKDEK